MNPFSDRKWIHLRTEIGAFKKAKWTAENVNSRDLGSFGACSRENNKKNSHKGIFQLGEMYKKAWAEKYQFRWEDVYDPRHNAEVYMKMVKTHYDTLKKRNMITSDISKISPADAGLIYGAHNQGLDGIITINNASLKINCL